MDTRAAFHTGERIVYPLHGMGRIDDVCLQTIEGQPQRCYRLMLAGRARGEVLVPVAYAKALGLRHVLQAIVAVARSLEILSEWVKELGKMLPLAERFGLRYGPMAHIGAGLFPVVRHADCRPKMQLDFVEIAADLLGSPSYMIHLPARELFVGSAHQDDAVGDPPAHCQDPGLVGSHVDRYLASRGDQAVGPFRSAVRAPIGQPP